MMPSSASSKKKKEGLDSDSEESNSVSSGHENGKQPRTRWSDTSRTTNEPSSASATVSTTVGTRHPTAQSVTLPSFPAVAAAAAPAVPRNEKKPSRAGFRGGFLQMLRVMLDRESQNDSSTVQWSDDGNSFIVTDHTQFEEHIIPTYFDKQIVFSSFLRKLYRWGFKRVPSRQFGHYEFGSPTFKRLDAGSAPAAAAAAAAADTSSNGGGASIQVQQQPTQAFSSSLQQVMAQTNRLPASNPLPASQADANAIMALLSNLSNIQRQLSSQQPSIPSQQSVLNQSTNNPLNMIHILQSFQQRQHPTPTLNLLNTALSILASGQAPSSAHLMGYSSVSHQRNAVHALMSLYGMTLPQPTLPNIITSAAISQPTNEAVQTLLTLMHQMGEDERERAQADAVNHAIISTIGQFVGGNIMIDEAQRQRGLAAALGQTHGNTWEMTTPHVPLGSGMTFGVPPINAAQSQQVGAPPPPADNLNIQAISIAAILQAARRGDAAGQLETARAQNNYPDNGDDEDGNDGEGKAE